MRQDQRSIVVHPIALSLRLSARMGIFKGGLRQIAWYWLMLERIIKKTKKTSIFMSADY